MKLQFKHQKFQADAAKAVCDVFLGQPYLTSSYLIDRGREDAQIVLSDNREYTGWSNQSIVPQLSDKKILSNIQAIQRDACIKPSEKLEGRFNLTIMMETGVGKTYTYIKTMFELNKQYGWTKFIVVVPSVAIREGVYKSFQITQEHFAEEYGKKIRFFIYNSSQLTEIDRFASDSGINVMIINSQAFNARGKDARRIHMQLDEFRSRRPIDIIASTHPILIIDEPQSVEGQKTKEGLKDFRPLFTLRYSATPKDTYNLIYRLDAVEAYNKKLVKKIAVKGIVESGSTATEGYLYLQSINLSSDNPTATIQFDYKGKNGVRKITRVVGEGFNLYENSEELQEYKNGYIVRSINGFNNSIELLNGLKLYVGEVIGQVAEEQLRRLQIRETILSHIERERQLYSQGIKVLSLFFIDEVVKYRQYDENGIALNGIYAEIFEQEYRDILSTFQTQIGKGEYLDYLSSIDAHNTHAGYFSIDKKSNRMVDSKYNDKKEQTSDDVDAYNLIMKNKERLLDFREPVRFIFSHSALREGWDNPNVFQICTLKQSGSDIRKRQEVGRGLRLCVNQIGERMDANFLGEDVHSVNVLTIIASESYDSFAKGLQTELAEVVADRVRLVTPALFSGKRVHNLQGNEQVLNEEMATSICEALITQGYVKNGRLTEKFMQDKQKNHFYLDSGAEIDNEDILTVLNSIYTQQNIEIENARSQNVELKIDKEKLASKEFQALWAKINTKSFYTVDFDIEELIEKAVQELNRKLRVPKIYFQIEAGSMEKIHSKDTLLAGEAFKKEDTSLRHIQIYANKNIKYDLIGRMVNETRLTRKNIVEILSRIDKKVFDQFKDNPEAFILKAASLIKDQVATSIVQHISYKKLPERYSTEIFTEPTLKGQMNINVIKVKHHLYDHILYDSDKEKEFALNLDTSSMVKIYAKLPKGFYINTPVGHYNPDWAIALQKDEIKHVYFVAETKGSLRSMQLREIEKAKINCAKEHFRAISTDSVFYDVVSNYTQLIEMLQFSKNTNA